MRTPGIPCQPESNPRRPGHGRTHPGHPYIRSGMRKSCDCAMYLDWGSMIEDAIPIYTSDKYVLLTPGIHGILPTKYIRKVVDMRRRLERYNVQNHSTFHRNRPINFARLWNDNSWTDLPGPQRRHDVRRAMRRQRNDVPNVDMPPPHPDRQFDLEEPIDSSTMPRPPPRQRPPQY